MAVLGIGDKAPEFIWQTAALQLTRDLLGGTDAMRAAGKKYLPQRAAEEDESYQVRLQGAVLLNQYDRTGGYMAGQVFQKPIRYQEPQEGETRDTLEWDFWDAFYEDADGQGTNLSVFSNRVFRAGIDDGVAFIVPDYSDVTTVIGEDGGLYYKDADGNQFPKTEQADAENGWRPYFVLVKADQVLDCRQEIVNGVSTVSYFRYMEITARNSGNGWVRVDRVRVFTRDAWELWEQAEGEHEFSLVNSGALTNEKGEALGRVPVVWYLPGRAREDGHTAQPAMKDLAWLNVSHWEASADHKELMRWVRSPVWFGVNVKNTDGTYIPFGPGRLVNVDADGASLESKGVDPSSVEKSFQDLKKIEDDMTLYGLQMLTSSTASMTATQADIAESASNSQLKEWVETLADTLENALVIIAAWKGFASAPAIAANTEFRIAYNANLVTQLATMVNNSQLSKQTLLETLKLMGVFADEFKVDEELVRIAEAQDLNQSYTPSFFGSGLEEAGQ